MRAEDLTVIVLVCVLPAGILLATVHRHPRWPVSRTLCGLGGLAALGVAASLDSRADALLSWHMVEHLLLSVLAAPLLVAAAPLRLALGTLPRGGRRVLAAALRRPAARVLSYPGVGLALFVVTLAVVHLPAVYDLALRVPLVHAAEHAALLWSAIALWTPVIAAEILPHRAGVVARVAAVVGAMAAMGALGATIASAPGAIYASYPDLADQQQAGGIMWVSGMVVLVPVLLWSAWTALIGEERRQRAREAHADRAAAGPSPGSEEDVPAAASVLVPTAGTPR